MRPRWRRRSRLWIYQVGLWRFGLAVVRTLPAWLVNVCCLLVAEFHFRLQQFPRREVVVQNLLPARSSGDSVAGGAGRPAGCTATSP